MRWYLPRWMVNLYPEAGPLLRKIDLSTMTDDQLAGLLGYITTISVALTIRRHRYLSDLICDIFLVLGMSPLERLSRA